MFILFIVVKFLIVDNQNAYGRIKIVSTPSAGIFIDNVSVGKTPYEDKFKTGEFVVKLIPEGEGDQTVSWQGKVKINKNSLTYVNRELGKSEVTSAGEIFTITKMEKSPKNSTLGEVLVETEPSGAIVYLDNDEKGISPLVLQDVPRGDHELSVFMPGFFRRTQKINVEGEYRVNTQIKLSLDENQKTLDQTLEEKRKESSASAQQNQEAKVIEKITIQSTSTGFLRVRSEPSLAGEEVGQVKPGETYDILEEQNGWYKIKFDETEGWVSGQYAKKEENITPTPTIKL